MHQAGNSGILCVVSFNDPGAGNYNSIGGSFRAVRTEVGFHLSNNFNGSTINTNRTIYHEVRNGSKVVSNLSSNSAITYGSLNCILTLSDLGNATASSRSKLYVNNNLYQNNTQTTSPSVAGATRQQTIGVTPVGSNSVLNGNMSEFVVFNQDMNSSVSAIKSNVSDYYSLNL